MGFWKELGKVGTFVGASLIDSAFSRHNAKKSVEMSDDSWKYRQSNAIQLTQQDMKNANLNPILAVTQGATSGVGSASPTPMENTKSIEYINAKNVAKQLDIEKFNAVTNRMAQTTNAKVADANIENTKATTKKTQAETENIILSQDNIKAQFDNLKADTEIKKQQLENLKMEFSKLQTDILAALQDIENGKRLTDARIHNLEAQNAHFAALTEQAYKNGIYLDSQTEFTKAKTEGQKSINVATALDTEQQKNQYIGYQGSDTLKFFRFITKEIGDNVNNILQLNSLIPVGR